MNEDTLKTINNLVLQSKSGLLLVGPSCLGKTYFAHYLQSQAEFVYAVGDGRFPKLKLESGFIRSKKAPDCTKGRVAIVLGVPWYIWKERNTIRVRQPEYDSTRFKENYVKIIKKLEEYNIPHIFIDNRNDYPILDKSSFLEILQG